MIDKNKIEQAAKEYADNLRPLDGLDKFDAPYLTAFEHHSDIEEGFKAGVEFAEKEMKDEIKEFCRQCMEFGIGYLGHFITFDEWFDKHFKEKNNERSKEETKENKV